ncbi:MAG: nicotinate-nucleotide--dimethylbenzimidazole phosphoribosyltransferase [Christensenellaceae bacterium]|nr:nicotinate-nucleotide--dimethylbenzimidazole phosphoribosyltransferase [Christensenellaceae bacterium]MEA5069328.1 nicotinate-nucleotide--dimethylbenzimidazole phosphoribosyltransferase [Christensenellaceae bacterium]
MIREIRPLDEAAMRMAQKRWDGIAKPLNGLGLLEQMVVRIAGMQQSCDVSIDRRCVLVLCADNGVVCEGVSQVGREVSALVAENIARGAASVNAMARAARADVVAVDSGLATDVDCPALLRRKLAYGTGNIAAGPAMTRGEAQAMIEIGIELAETCADQGYQLLLTGEMGIGNTTTSGAVAAALLGLSPEAVTGRGAGLSDAGLMRKRSAIERAIALNRPDPGDPIDVLSKLGGFDLAAMAGVFLGGARRGLPVVIDGLISGVAALIAARLLPAARDYMLTSHLSRELAGQCVLEALGLPPPVLHAQMALGEGTGAVALLPLIDMALNVYRQNSTFDEIHLPAYTPQ